APRYAGPYRILRWAHKDNSVSIVLETPKELGVGKSYHVNRLKKFVEDGDPNREQVLRPDAQLVEDAEEFEVEAILDHRYKRRLGKQTLEYLVKWVGYDQAESTWEPEEHLGNAQEILGKYRERSGLSP
ncbi:chromo domain-containing protein, partial [Acinetobacter baumannii]